MKKGSASERRDGLFGDRELALAVAELAQVREEVDAGQVRLARRCRARRGAAIVASRSARRRGGPGRRTSCAARAPRPAIGASTPSIAGQALARRAAATARAALEQRVELLDLGDADRGGDVGEPVVEAEAAVVEPAHVGGAALVALAAQARRRSSASGGTSIPPSPVVICLLA